MENGPNPKPRSRGVTTVKRLLALLVAVTFATGTAGFAFAQTPAPMKEKAAEKRAEMKEKMPAKNAVGTVKSASADSVVVAGKEKVQGAKELKDVEWTFAVDSKTSIKKGSKAITPGDIKAGDSVQVKYMEHDGKATAQSVMVKGAATSAKKMDKMEAKPADKK